MLAALACAAATGVVATASPASATLSGCELGRDYAMTYGYARCGYVSRYMRVKVTCRSHFGTTTVVYGNWVRNGATSFRWCPTLGGADTYAVGLAYQES